MEQFSLEKYLENPTRKVVTRDGRPVRILCTDAKAKDGCCIIAAIETDGEEEGYQFFKNGKAYSSKSSIEDCADLFFADEEKELTEFEKELQIIISEASHWTSDDGSMSTYCYFGDKEIKKISGKIINLARKEILKDLPKWKKAKKDEELDCHVAIQQDDRVVLSDFVQKDEYYITLDVLKKLPKEE